MRVFITGADGLLGNNLVRECLYRKFEVRVLLVNETTEAKGLRDLPIDRVYGNILDPTAVRKGMEGIDVVIHLAASTQVNPPRAKNINDVNIIGTQNIIQSAKDLKIKRLIHVGTANSFGPGSRENPGNEMSPYSGFKYRLDYFDSKFKAQEMVLQAAKNEQLDALVVNPSFMIGPLDSKPSSGALILALVKKKIPVCTPGSRTYVAVKDASHAIANAITLGKNGECYILGNESLTYSEFFKLLSKSLQVNVPKITLPSMLIRSYGKFNSSISKLTGKPPILSKEMATLSCENHCYSGEKARNELKMPHTPLNIAIKEAFEWFVENGYH